jgi:Fic family protein
VKIIVESGNNGKSVSEISEQLPEVSRRTVQRTLKALVESRAIKATGNGPNRRYFSNSAEESGTTRLAGSDANTISWSTDSSETIRYVSQPVTQRTPVGYQFEFLDEYQPNRTYYLPTPLRLQLRKMGEAVQIESSASTYTRDILNRLMIDLSWASSQLEGNTYSRLDTLNLIEGGRSADGKKAQETQMILNHKEAIEFLLHNVKATSFNRHTLLNLHGILSDNLLANPADEGRIRQQIVEITSSAYRPLSAPQQLDSQFDNMLTKLNAIEDPFEQSFFVMVHLPYLQPFIDVNKRASRLAANLPLFKHRLCPLTFIDLPESAYTTAILCVYETTTVEALRDVYVWAYERSTQDYLALKQEMAAPDPLRLQWRNLIKQVIHDVIRQVERPPMEIINKAVSTEIPESEQEDVRALIVAELKRVHIGVLARYGVRPSQFEQWRAAQEQQTKNP